VTLRAKPFPFVWDANVTSAETTIGGLGVATETVPDQAYYVVFSLVSGGGDLVIGDSGVGVILEDGAGGIRNWGTYVTPGTVITLTGANGLKFNATYFYNKL